MRTVIAATLVVAGFSFIAAPATAAQVNTCARTPVAAHRGIKAGGVTENSRGSVQAALNQGARPEVDLRATADNKIVLMHDQTISRTTSGTGEVFNLNGDQIRRHPLNDGQTVPYAAAILRMVRNKPSAHIIIELKALNPVTQRTLRDAINAYGIAGRVEMISFREGQIADFRHLNRNIIKTYLIVGGLPSIRVAARNGGAHVFPQFITPEWRRKMDTRGIPFSGRIADTPAGWTKAVKVGVTSVMSDDVSGYRTWCATSGAV